MGYCALTAFMESERIPPSGFVVTAVLKGGCPLNCPFCIVNQRDERREQSYLTTDHLTGLLAAVERRGLLGGAAIVGDEPLQSHCWPTARAFLSHAADRNLPTALISNGYNLIDFVDELRALSTTKITISLDAASEKHDEIRRKPGAFARISEGIRLAVSDPGLRERLSIAAILMPGNLETISEIIAFTAANGIPQLLLSPLLTSSRTTPLTVHPKIMKEAWRAIPQPSGSGDGGRRQAASLRRVRHARAVGGEAGLDRHRDHGAERAGEAHPRRCRRTCRNFTHNAGRDYDRRSTPSRYQ